MWEGGGFPRVQAVVSQMNPRSPVVCPNTKASTESCREYYMWEGGGFPRVRAVVSQVSPRSPVACPNTRRVQNEF
jgi:hypothetical protein